MDFPDCKWLLLVAVVMLQVGCASDSHPPDYTTTGLEPAVSHEDDSHGWGANVQGNSH